MLATFSRFSTITSYAEDGETQVKGRNNRFGGSHEIQHSDVSLSLGHVGSRCPYRRARQPCPGFHNRSHLKGGVECILREVSCKTPVAINSCHLVKEQYRRSVFPTWTTCIEIAFAPYFLAHKSVFPSMLVSATTCSGVVGALANRYLCPRPTSRYFLGRNDGPKEKHCPSGDDTQEQAARHKKPVIKDTKRKMEEETTPAPPRKLISYRKTRANIAVESTGDTASPNSVEPLDYVQSAVALFPYLTLH